MIFGLCFMVVTCVVLQFFFVFKQKTAYEMRISDWSSDVCSSDLSRWKAWPSNSTLGLTDGGLRKPLPLDSTSATARSAASWTSSVVARRFQQSGETSRSMGHLRLRRIRSPRFRSEEHTSEHQSLMSTSFAVFCLKKINSINNKKE